MRTVIETVVNAASAAQNNNGTVIDAQQLAYATAQATVSGGTSIVAAIKIQGSNDIPSAGLPDANFTPTNWADIANSSTAISGNVSITTPVATLAFRWVRAAYVFTSGTGGTVTVNFVGTGFGR